MSDKPVTTLEKTIECLREEIQARITDMADTKRELGSDFDPNSYGAGWDEGELSGMRFALSYMESLLVVEDTNV